MGMPYRTLDGMPKERVKAITQEAHMFIEAL